MVSYIFWLLFSYVNLKEINRKEEMYLKVKNKEINYGRGYAFDQLT